MSLSVAGVWQVGVWAETVWADGVWREGDVPEPTELTGGVKARKVKYEHIEPVWKQKETDSIDVQIVRELKKSLKQHKPDIIDVKGEVEAQIRAIYHNQEIKKVIKKRKRQKALAIILMDM